MKSRRLQYRYRSNSSKLHKAVGDTLRNSDTFKGYRVYQEYPVSSIDPDFPNNRAKFDWVILDMDLVIECHGKQHYVETSFGKGNSKSLKEIQAADEKKKQAALSSGYYYLVIPYTDEKLINEEYLAKKIKEADAPIGNKKEVKSKTKNTWPTNKMSYDKDKAREYRKERYKRQKEWARERNLTSWGSGS